MSLEESVYIGFGDCFGCQRLFAFDVEKVPSYAGKPICRDCIDRANARRKAAGRPLWRILPGAYPLEDPGED
jgi:hypothetical protein